MVKQSPLRNPKNQAGGVAFIIFTFLFPLLTWVIFQPIFILVLVSSSVSVSLRRKAQRAVNGITSWFMKQEVAAIEFFLGVHYIDYGDVNAITNTDENVLIIANHPTLFDWMFLWTFFAKYSKLHKFRVILKKELQYFPIIGYCVQIAMFLFLARDWAADQNTIKTFLQYYQDYCEHYQLLIFPEGTNIGSHSIPKADQFTERQNIKPFNEVLPPRTTGFINIFFQLTGLSHIFTQFKDMPVEEQKKLATVEKFNAFVNLFSSVDAIYDFTIAYTPTRSSSQVNLVTGKHPITMHTHLNRIEIQQCLKEIMAIDLKADAKYYLDDKSNPYNPQSDETDQKLAAMTPEQIISEQIGVWVMNKWYAKDEMLDQFYTKIHAQASESQQSSANKGSPVNKDKSGNKSQQQQQQHFGFPVNTVLLDQKTYIACSKPYYIYQWKHCLLSLFWLGSIMYFLYALPFFRYLAIVNVVISILTLTVLKWQLHETVIKGAKAYEEKCIQMIKKDENVVITNSDCELIRRFTTIPTLHSVAKITAIQNSAHQDDADTQSSYTPRQIRLQQREESRQLQLQRAIKRGEVSSVSSSAKIGETGPQDESPISPSSSNDASKANGASMTLTPLDDAAKEGGKLAIPIDGDRYVNQGMDIGLEHYGVFALLAIFYTISFFS